MKTNSIFTILFFLLFGFVNAAHAVEQSDVNRLRREVEALNRACARQPCQAPYQRREFSDISDRQKQTLTELANDLAQVWGDTILEGDYYADGHTVLDRVEVLYKNGETFAYKIRYYENAYYTGECDFDGRRRQTLQGCEPGRIVESSYLSSDLKLYFRDPSQWVEFEPSNP